MYNKEWYWIDVAITNDKIVWILLKTDTHKRINQHRNLQHPIIVFIIFKNDENN